MKSNSLAVRLLIYALPELLTKSKSRGETERVQNTQRIHLSLGSALPYVSFTRGQTDMVGDWNYMVVDVIVCCCGEAVAVVCMYEK